MRHTGSLAETVPYAQHSLTEAADIEHARTLLGAVLSAELPAMIDPGNFDSLPVQQHDKLCKLAAEVMRTACP
ncbi:MAG TPA: hypothetical protein VM124_00795, partial [Candidatus Limnocylindrales bacterium]|nr:hypothetical protein [Candidatus Limnocylindrales bacterium]